MQPIATSTDGLMWSLLKTVRTPLNPVYFFRKDPSVLTYSFIEDIILYFFSVITYIYKTKSSCLNLPNVLFFVFTSDLFMKFIDTKSRYSGLLEKGIYSYQHLTHFFNN